MKKKKKERNTYLNVFLFFESVRAYCIFKKTELVLFSKQPQRSWIDVSLILPNQDRNRLYSVASLEFEWNVLKKNTLQFTGIVELWNMFLFNYVFFFCWNVFSFFFWVFCFSQIRSLTLEGQRFASREYLNKMKSLRLPSFAFFRKV